MTCIGVDGCKGGWVVASRTHQTIEFQVVPDFMTLHKEFVANRGATVCIDIPIGLLDGPRCEARLCDVEARKLLKGKTSSIFNPPSRFARKAPLHTLHELGMSSQGIGFMPKVFEVDDLMTPEIQVRVIESHPELAFAELTGAPLLSKKRELGGALDRIKALNDRLGWEIDPSVKVKGAGLDDLLDAAVLLHVAEKFVEGRAKRIPESPPLDSKRLRMEIWF